jgi:hypothetical protein
MKEMVILNREEQKRLVMLEQVEVGNMTGRGTGTANPSSLQYSALH